jgi:hypothetical protein
VPVVRCLLLRGDAGSWCQTSIQGLLDQGSCASHWDILLVILLNLRDLWFGLWNNWSWLGNRLWLRSDRFGLWDSDWSGVRGRCAVRGTHLY